MEHEEYMRRALELARRGEGHVSPNPMVGCVVVKDGRVISEGTTRRSGSTTRNAMRSSGARRTPPARTST